MVFQFFTGSWGRTYVEWLVRGGRGLKGKITPRKLILFEMIYLHYIGYCKGIVIQVDLKALTIKPLNAS